LGNAVAGGKAKKKEPEAEGETPEGGAPGKKKLSGKKLVLFIILPAVLVLAAGGGAAMMLLKGPSEAHAEADAHGAKGKDKAKGKDSHGKDGHGKDGEGGAHALTVTEGEGVYFVALPELLVNITTADGGAAYLKLRLTLEATDEASLLALEPAMPRIMDQFQSFLRELRTDDFAGSGGAYRVRLELMRRVNLVIAPARINAVLVEEMLIQ
jgi:flagellar FliL protein